MLHSSRPVNPYSNKKKNVLLPYYSVVYLNPISQEDIRGQGNKLFNSCLLFDVERITTFCFNRIEMDEKINNCNKTSLLLVSHLLNRGKYMPLAYFLSHRANTGDMANKRTQLLMATFPLLLKILLMLSLLLMVTTYPVESGLNQLRQVSRRTWKKHQNQRLYFQNKTDNTCKAEHNFTIHGSQVVRVL